MDPKWQFFFFLAALLSFLLGALIAWKGQGPSALRDAVAAGFVGLAFYVGPILWNTGEVAF